MNAGMWGKGVACFLVLCILPGVWVGSGEFPLPLERNINPFVPVWLVCILLVQLATLKYVWQRPTLCTLAQVLPPPPPHRLSPLRWCCRRLLPQTPQLQKVGRTPHHPVPGQCLMQA